VGIVFSWSTDALFYGKGDVIFITPGRPVESIKNQEVAVLRERLLAKWLHPPIVFAILASAAKNWISQEEEFGWGCPSVAGVV
jgi:hypothetical protein